MICYQYATFLLYPVFVVFKIVCLFAAIAYYVLTERKIMAAVQRRRGPNVTGFWGLLQPLADGLKLFAKEMVIPSHSNQKIFLLAPITILTLSLSSWTVIPFQNSDPIRKVTSSDLLTQLTAHQNDISAYSTFFKDLGFFEAFDGVATLQYGVLLLLALSSLNVYGIIIAGWASSSKYAFLGALRSAAQMISYEVSISLVILSVVVLSGSLDLTGIVYAQSRTLWFIFPLFPMAIIFFIAMLAETNRAPFDLPEAEAELVAGYNVEYSSMIFAMFFLGEYSNMLLMSTLASIFFLGGWHNSFLNEYCPSLTPFVLSFKTTLVAIFFILIRASYPRYRYDQLMDLGWKIFLPVGTAFFIFQVGLLRALNAAPLNLELLGRVTGGGLSRVWQFHPALKSQEDFISICLQHQRVWKPKFLCPVEASLFDTVDGLCGDFFFQISASFLAYLLPCSGVVLCLFVIFASNPVHSLLSLIGVFFQVVILLLAAKAEFLGFVFLIVYIGAIAILFLFVLMLFNLKELGKTQAWTLGQWSAFGLALPAAIKMYLVLQLMVEEFCYSYMIPRYHADATEISVTLLADSLATTSWASTARVFSTETFYSIQAIGATLYDLYTLPFIVVGYVLLTAMLGAIVLAMQTLEIPVKTK